MKSKNDFEYSYSAPTAEERKEIESIKNNYTKTSTSTKLEKLRKLDNKVKQTPTILALVIGIIGTLVFGLGMAMVLEWSLIVFGVFIGVIGFIVLILAYPIYNKISTGLTNKYKDEILKLSDELLNDKNKSE